MLQDGKNLRCKRKRIKLTENLQGIFNAFKVQGQQYMLIPEFYCWNYIN